MLVPAFSQLDECALQLLQCVSTLHEQWRMERLHQKDPSVGMICKVEDDRAHPATARIMSRSPLPKLTRLVCCILLTVIELFRGHSYSAFTLIKHCRALIQLPIVPEVDISSDQEIISKELAPMIKDFEMAIEEGAAKHWKHQIHPWPSNGGDLCQVVVENLINLKSLSQDAV